MLSSLGAERIALKSSAGNLAIKIDLHAWGYADSYQVVGWYFIEQGNLDVIYPEPHLVASIAEPFRDSKGRDTTSLKPAKGAWWYFLELGG